MRSQSCLITNRLDAPLAPRSAILRKHSSHAVQEAHQGAFHRLDEAGAVDKIAVTLVLDIAKARKHVRWHRKIGIQNHEQIFRALDRKACMRPWQPLVRRRSGVATQATHSSAMLEAKPPGSDDTF